jgi:hypothetical protein
MDGDRLDTADIEKAFGTFFRGASFDQRKPELMRGRI